MSKILSRPKILLLIVICIASFLRLYKLSEVPVSLFGDELDVGYQAYSVLKTGRDYQGNLMPLHFHSLAEWRTPLYLYSSVPTVALFGISPLGVRLPAAIFGIFGILGIYLLILELMGYKSGVRGYEKIKTDTSIRNIVTALTASFFLGISPWHIQYSRAGFEVTQLLAFLLFGLYFFFRSLRLGGRGLWISVLLLCFTPWIYSTAKLFTPLLLVFLFLVWRKEILNFPLSGLLRSLILGFLIGLPIAYSTFFGGGTQRASYISIFTNPVMQSEVGTARLKDLMVRGKAVLGSTPSLPDRLFHNKFTFWFQDISGNYLQSLSFDFLFNRGDPNLRHSTVNTGEFLKIDVILFVIGLIMLFGIKGLDLKIKTLIAFWIIIGILPSAITRDGGNHASRLIIILPPLIFLMAYGLYGMFQKLRPRWGYIFLTTYSLLLTISFSFYLHDYYVHYPWDSERWWHAGFKDAFKSVKDVDKDFDKIIISMAGEPAWIFFAGWYQYPPLDWQKNFPLNNNVELKGFGMVSHINKYYFGKFSEKGSSIYDLGKYIDNKTLYLAVAKEVPPNLIMEPDRTPPDLRLIRSIAYPSGEPAYYLFTKI